jgi:hypothetical protein
MKSHAYIPSLQRCATPLLALTLAVSLTGCSSFLELAQEAEAKQVVPAAAVAEAQPKPDIPPHLVKCIEKEKPVPAKATADALALHQKERAEFKKACGKAILQWYKEVQKADAAKATAKKS